MPEYPREAYVYSVQGRVRARLTLDAAGAVSVARIERAEPAGIFDVAVLEAVHEWRFTPGTPECWHDFRFHLDGDRAPPPLGFEDETHALAELTADRKQLVRLFDSLRARCRKGGDKDDPRTVSLSRIPAVLPEEPAAALHGLQGVAPCALSHMDELTDSEMLDLAAAFWSRGLGETPREAMLLATWRDHRAGVQVEPLRLARAREEFMVRFHDQIRWHIIENSRMLGFPDNATLKLIGNAISRMAAGDKDEAIAMLKGAERQRNPSNRALAGMTRGALLLADGQLVEGLAAYRTVADDPRGDPLDRYSAYRELLMQADSRGDLADWERVFAKLRASKLLPPALETL